MKAPFPLVAGDLGKRLYLFIYARALLNEQSYVSNLLKILSWSALSIQTTLAKCIGAPLSFKAGFNVLCCSKSRPRTLALLRNLVDADFTKSLERKKKYCGHTKHLSAIRLLIILTAPVHFVYPAENETDFFFQLWRKFLLRFNLEALFFWNTCGNSPMQFAIQLAIFRQTVVMKPTNIK